MLQNLSKNIGDKQLANLTLLTNSLKNISNEAQLVESKINNQTQIDTKQSSNLVQNKTSSPINNTQVQNQTNLLASKENISLNTKEILSQLKGEILATKNIPNAPPTLVKQIDSLLQSNNLFIKKMSL